MVYKHYTLGIAKRIVYVVLAAMSTGYFIAIESNNYVPEIASLIFLSVSIIALTNYIRKTNQQISYFIQAVRNDDTSLRFPQKTGNKTIDELHKSLNELNVILQKNKLETELKERYFSEILQQIKTGIIVFDDNGFVTDVNNAALELLDLRILTHIKQIDKTDKNFRQRIEGFCGQQKEVLNIRTKMS